MHGNAHLLGMPKVYEKGANVLPVLLRTCRRLASNLVFLGFHVSAPGTV